jgi:cytochrome c-type biogenesis protein CcmH
MLIWAVFAAMTAAAVTIPLVPLARRRLAGGAVTEAGDVAVYRDQLAEVDRDVAEGRLAASEGEAARAEIARRLLRAARRGEATAEPATLRRRRLLSVGVAVVAVPLIALGVYSRLGHPELHDRPLAARLAAPPERLSMDELVARVEGRLASQPDDARGWELIAPLYLRMGRTGDAVAAFRHAIRLSGPNEARLNGLGEALTAEAGGKVDADAKSTFEASLALSPKGVLPRMYLALERAQAGRLDEAVEAWRALVASGRPNDPWMPVARAELAKVEAAAAGRPPPVDADAAATPGPTAAEVDAAAELSAEDRAAMIDAMVARLDERLRRDGGSVDDWARLVRSLRTVGKADAAADALARARSAHAGDPKALARLDALIGGR